jgi:hypothetical protein
LERAATILASGNREFDGNSVQLPSKRIDRVSDRFVYQIAAQWQRRRSHYSLHLPQGGLIHLQESNAESANFFRETIVSLSAYFEYQRRHSRRMTSHN